MRELLFNRLTLIWVLLVAATALSWAMGHRLGLQDREIASIAIIGIAVLKARYVILDFMELRGASLVPRLVAEAWGVVLGLAMIGFYLRSA